MYRDGVRKAARWGVDAILTDVPKTWLELRLALDCKLIYQGQGNRGMRTYVEI
jgi:hypothetical protein